MCTTAFAFSRWVLSFSAGASLEPVVYCRGMTQSWSILRLYVCGFSICPPLKEAATPSVPRSGQWPTNIAGIRLWGLGWGYVAGSFTMR
jgi:hypothetical protein